MPLPPPEPRAALHTRNVVFRGYGRTDQLWDIEAELTDTKAKLLDIPGEDPIQAGAVLHGMSIRVTVDNTMTVRAIAVAMDGVPHAECPQAMAPMQSMVGCTMGRGWRQAIERNLGSAKGCAHLRELLFNMATVALQTVSHELPFDSSEHPPCLLYTSRCV